MSRPCRWIVALFLLLYLGALFLFAVGTFGLFGSERGSLAGIFLAPLGLPWNMLFVRAPDALLPWIGIAAPLLNLLLLVLYCRARRKR